MKSIFASTPARQRLARLRQTLKHEHLDGFIIPHCDEYHNEFLPPHHERLTFATNFTGSAGWAIVLKRRAAVFIDSRYTLQAEGEVDIRDFSILPWKRENIRQWLDENLIPHQRIGCDPSLHPPDEVDFLRNTCRANDAELAFCIQNPIDVSWASSGSRPLPEHGKISLHPMKYCGRNVRDKLSDIRADIRAERCDGLVIATPDNLCWLFNIRGNDVPYTPLTMGRALIPCDGPAQIFLCEYGPQNIDLLIHLGEEVLIDHLDNFAYNLAGWNGRSILVDRHQCNHALYDTIRSNGCRVILGEDPCQRHKAIKNDTEIEGARQAHIRDATAVIRFLKWLDDDQGGKINEIDAVREIERIRAQNPLFHGPSFPTIAASGPNGAIIHYFPKLESARNIESGDLFLIDSGAQYPDGTTDITRTVPIGTGHNDTHRRHYTLVLKGLIHLSSARFPPHVVGNQIDAFARMALWQDGIDYAHGTGHGVGSFSHVHEGPWRIAANATDGPIPAGVILSIEPGCYQAGQYGIRLENLALWRQYGDRMGFETLTLVPFDRRMININLLNNLEIAWIEDYHQRVLKTIGPTLPSSEQSWLKIMCSPLSSSAPIARSSTTG